ncbi:MAG: TetR/AcrR family transcriptional regulator [Jatrophihabitans sp.]
MPVKTRLTPTDWVDAATDLLADGGLAAVAVEPLAARLGATKGSFYWHFANRDDLIAALLDAWTDRHTDAVIRHVEAVADPRGRLRQLFSDVFGSRHDSRVELSLLASIDDPMVGRAMRLVTRRRVDYVAQCFAEFGIAAADARRHAVLAYSAYVGLIQAQQASGGRFLPARDRVAYLTFLEAQLFPG